MLKDETAANSHLKLLRSLLDRGISTPEDTSIFENFKHIDLVNGLVNYLSEYTYYFGHGHVESSHALNEKGVDVLFSTGQVKIGFQIKSYHDVTEKQFAANVKRQMTESLAHDLDHYIVLICCPLAKSVATDLEPRISHLLNEISQLKKGYHTAYGPVPPQ